jgi:hypothetical protein
MEENRSIRENMTDRFAVVYRPIVLIFAISMVLYWAGSFLKYQELILWARIGMMVVPFLIILGFAGSKVLLQRRTFHTRKEYVAFSLVFVILPIVPLIYAVLVFLGLLPFPDTSFSF